jgi:hypothetical protein
MTDDLIPKSLNAQIKDAERQIASRQRQVDACAAVLVEKIQQQAQQKITVTPATLLLAGGIGFIIAELSKCPPQQTHGSADKRRAAQTSPLKVALNLVTSARTLYAALPLVWLMTSRYQHPHPEKTPERQANMPDSDKTQTRPIRKSRYSVR